MSLPSGPRAWAGHLTRLLDAANPGPARFPVDVGGLALEYTAQVFPGDPIRRVEGRDLPGFEGALICIPGSAGGWGVAFNSAIRSPGRKRWTLAHELGHYLVHRHAFPKGITCSEDDVTHGADSALAIEREADQFAADLLMPFDDFRRRIAARDAADLDALSACADHYGVSLLAATLRWLAYTERRAVLAVSRDGFLLWARSSEPALKSGAFFRTKKEVVELPERSLAARKDTTVDNRAGVTHPPGVWLPEAATEMTVFSEQYDLALSLLTLGDAEPRWRPDLDEEEDPVAVAVDRRWR